MHLCMFLTKRPSSSVLTAYTRCSDSWLDGGNSWSRRVGTFAQFIRP